MICYVCKQEKEITEFYKDRSKKSGHSSRCKPCDLRIAKEYRERNPEKIKKLGKDYYEKASKDPAFNKARYEKHRDKYLKRKKEYDCKYSARLKRLIQSAKRRALIKGLSFTLTEEWLERVWEEQEGKCLLSNENLFLGILSETEYKDCRHHPLSPSLDRIDATKGYTEDNTRLVATCVNLALNRYGEDFMLDIFQKVLDNRAGRT